ncbi:tetratricopeptide repeat protein [Mucilaginibacter auburnensis]|uniref:Tetratricopeptide repeat protein n=1 Tax=Mucilaginibacter auburnensis TaxID=1457233 RepID=A0A2H9VQU8_9SPHI|nr:tetratricopeptide repeat protein [Mucilaginibacter auburnensis]PJJ83206.1 tetratricopeptide repeat protein [Mucilaginibacter auburnensis]
MSKTQESTQKPLNEKGLGNVSNFTRDNQKSLTFIVAAVVVMIAVYVLYQKLYLAPREVTASTQMRVAQESWAKKDWDKAIKGDAGYPGFEKIISEYSNTKAANLAHYYLGIAYLNKGEYNKAIENLNDYSGNDNMFAAEALGATGDAYVELKDYQNAASYFKKAVDKAGNDFLSPLYLKKLGLTYEAANNKEGAVDAYKSIKKDYPTSTEAQSIDAYIARVEAKL